MRFGVFFLSQTPEGATTPAEALRCGLGQNGGMPDEHVRRSIELFATEVMPALERSTVYA
jgi:hypothetical protein